MMGAGSRLLCRGGGRKSLNVCNRVVAVVAGVGIPEFNRQVVAWNGMASLTCCEQGSCGPHNGEVYCQQSVTSLHCVVVDAVVAGCVGVRDHGVSTLAVVPTICRVAVVVSGAVSCAVVGVGPAWHQARQ